MDYQILRSNRKTISLQIKPDGTVLVRAPQRLSRKAIDDFVKSKQGWLDAHLAKFENRPQIPRMTRQELEALADAALKDIPERVKKYAPLVGVSYGRITIRNQRTRWGSCSSQGNLNFNCLLMLAPEEVRDYVVVHELCHRRQMNHSARFWAEVARVLPDFETRRKWLKEHGSELMGRLPEG